MMVGDRRLYLTLFFVLFGFLIVFFAMPPIITFDSAHYHTYLSVLDGSKDWSEWNQVRGIVFPFLTYVVVSFFGSAPNGLLIIQFIVYCTAFFCMIFFLKSVLGVSNSNKLVALVLTVAILVFLDPVVMGYFHTWLTEFIGATLLAISCFFAYLIFRQGDNPYRISTYIMLAFFVIAVPFGWHLKQPYFLSAFAPLFALLIVSLINRAGKNKLLIQVVAVALSIVSLLLTMVLWNTFLSAHKVKDTVTSDSMLNSQIIGGLVYFNFSEFDPGNSEDAQRIDSHFLNEEKIQGALARRQNNEQLYLVSVYSTDHNLMDQRFILSTGVVSNLPETLKTWAKAVRMQPAMVLKGYFDTWMGVSNTYEVAYDGNGRLFIRSREFSLLRGVENLFFASRTLMDGNSNIFGMPENLREYVKNYEVFDSSPIIDAYVTNVRYKSNIIFTLMMLLMPLITIAFFIKMLIARKVDFGDGAIFILSFSGGLFILAMVGLGAMIDRYLFEAYFISYLIIVIGATKVYRWVLRLASGTKNKAVKAGDSYAQ